MTLYSVENSDHELPFIGKINFLAQNLEECSAVHLFSRILITHVQSGTLILLKKRHHISEEDIRSIIWLPTSKRVNKCIKTLHSNLSITLALII